jgi:acetyl esterase
MNCGAPSWRRDQNLCRIISSGRCETTSPRHPRIVRAAIALSILIGTTLSAQRAASTADSALEAYRARPSAMATQRFAALWTATPTQFRRTWDSSFVADKRALVAMQARLPAEIVERESARLGFRHLWGRTTWPFFHWRETNVQDISEDGDVARLMRATAIHDARWWSLPEHGELVAALVHERGRRLMASDRTLRQGDVRWLRAEFAAARALFRDVALQRHVTTRLIIAHLDDNDARGIDSVRTRWLALAPDSITVHRVDSMIAASEAQREGHVIEPYRNVDGVPLEIHVLRPTAGDTVGLRPAMLWFHGGSGTTGSWSHSPGVVRSLRSNGIAVVAVEFRTGSRFDAGPIEQYEDAIEAIRYVRRNATRLGIDARRIGVSGFSSGAGLALMLGTRGTSAARPSPLAATRVYPAAVIVTGACVAPAGPREDGYFRKMVRRVGDPADYSPIDLVASGQPPTLLVHATRDEYCSFEDAQAFTTRSRAVGNDVVLSVVDGATHFFGFYHKPGQEQMRGAIADALAKWRWLDPTPRTRDTDR